MPTICVIVPVYKVEPYLRQCVDSILNQTFQDFEVVLVNDGSPDNCPAICDAYAEKDSRIRVMHKENGGISSARNAALDWVYANSDSNWITFVDSDDCLSPVCLERLYEAAVENGADISITYGEPFADDSQLANTPQNVVSIKLMNGKESCISFYRGEVVDVPVWGKLFSRKILEGQRFPDGKIHEDEDFTPKMLYCADKVVILRSWLYCYRQRAGSIVHSEFSMKRFDHIWALDSCIRFFEEREETEITALVRKRREQYLAKYTLLAHGMKLTKSIPHQYSMPVWKAFIIVIKKTVCGNSVNYFWKRIRNYYNEITHQKSM